MRTAVRISLCLLLTFECPVILSQERNIAESIVSIAENLAADDTDPESVGIYIERLHELADDPVMINSADEEETARLFFLTSFQVSSLAEYVRSNGKILTVYEIMNIPGFDRELAETMLPFITLGEKVSKASPRTPRVMLISGVSYKTGYDNNSSKGSPCRIMSRAAFRSGGLSGGVTGEKDPGENFFTGDPPLPDFFSSFLSYKGTGTIRKIIIGDYSARIGQGTGLNTAMRAGVTLTSQGYLPSRNEIKPYTSAGENNFFRGVSAEIAPGRKLSLILFYSRNKIDASVGDGEPRQITSFYTAGLHDSNSNLLKKDAVTDFTYGTSLALMLKRARIGALWSKETFSLPVAPGTDNPPDHYDFSGSRNSIGSVWYNWQPGKILYYGELSLDQLMHYSLVQGVSIRLSDRLTTGWLFRSNEPGYFSMHGKGPGYDPGTNGGRILSGSFTFEAAKHLFVSAGSELRTFPWLRYRCSSPSYGKLHEIRVKYLPLEELALEALYSHRVAASDEEETTGVPKLLEETSEYGRFSVRFSPSKNLSFLTRIDHKIISPAGYRGSMLLQKATIGFRRLPVTLWISWCLFSTEDWSARIYAYENDLLYNFNVPALSGEGSRSYIMLKWKPVRFIEARVKYGITSISCEEDTEDIRAQVRISF